ncbi:MAG TPA: hypothetical protein VKY56_00835 [Chloroflexota bacterium]|nr:hypothetical protein [Chloroflexota bacterium]
MKTITERWPRGLMDPPECPVCGGIERDPESLACWHCKKGHYADCRWIRDVAAKLPYLSEEDRRVWRRLTEILPEEEILRRLGTPRPR